MKLNRSGFICAVQYAESPGKFNVVSMASEPEKVTGSQQFLL
jgi:hypothetical protein